MKLILFTILSITATLSTAVPPPRYSTLSRQQTPPQPQPASAPYHPSGWKPEGERLELPVRQVASTPSASYGPPKQVYGPPKQVYGPPKDLYGVPTTTEFPTTTDIDFTEEPEIENFEARPLRNQNQQKAETVERGQYYLLLPDGRLQRVQYVTSADLQRMAYSAKLRYQDVEPITGPIFTTANNQPFFPIFQK